VSECARARVPASERGRTCHLVRTRTRVCVRACVRVLLCFFAMRNGAEASRHGRTYHVHHHRCVAVIRPHLQDPQGEARRDGRMLHVVRVQDVTT
jgi:hypothetical protein